METSKICFRQFTIAILLALVIFSVVTTTPLTPSNKESTENPIPNQTYHLLHDSEKIDVFEGSLPFSDDQNNLKPSQPSSKFFSFSVKGKYKKVNEFELVSIPLISIKKAPYNFKGLYIAIAPAGTKLFKEAPKRLIDELSKIENEEKKLIKLSVPRFSFTFQSKYEGEWTLCLDESKLDSSKIEGVEEEGALSSKLTFKEISISSKVYVLMKVNINRKPYIFGKILSKKLWLQNNYCAAPSSFSEPLDVFKTNEENFDQGGGSLEDCNVQHQPITSFLDSFLLNLDPLPHTLLPLSYYSILLSFSNFVDDGTSVRKKFEKLLYPNSANNKHATLGDLNKCFNSMQLYTKNALLVGDKWLKSMNLEETDLITNSEMLLLNSEKKTTYFLKDTIQGDVSLFLNDLHLEGITLLNVNDFRLNFKYPFVQEQHLRFFFNEQEELHFLSTIGEFRLVKYESYDAIVIPTGEWKDPISMYLISSKAVTLEKDFKTFLPVLPKLLDPTKTERIITEIIVPPFGFHASFDGELSSTLNMYGEEFDFKFSTSNSDLLLKSLAYKSMGRFCLDEHVSTRSVPVSDSEEPTSYIFNNPFYFVLVHDPSNTPLVIHFMDNPFRNGEKCKGF